MAAAEVVLYQKCHHASKPCGSACAKAEFGEQVLADVAVATITKAFQIPCIGLAHCACVLVVANMTFVAEQLLKSGHGMTCILSQEQDHRVKV